MIQGSDLLPVKTNYGKSSIYIHKSLEMFSRSLEKAIFQDMRPQLCIDYYEPGILDRIESSNFGLLSICKLVAGRHSMRINPRGDMPPGHRYIILLQRSGSSIIQQSGRTFFLNASQWAILDLHSGFRISSNRIVEQIFLNHGEISYLCQKSLVSDIPSVVFQDSCIFRLFNDFISEIVSRSADFGDGAANSVASLAYCFFRHVVMFHLPCLMEKPGSDSIHRSHILRYIESRLNYPLLNAKKIASKFGCSARTIYRKFNNGDKEGVEKYIWRRRIEMAELILRSSPKGLKPINIVAFECGFTSISHFCSAFKKRFNTTPSCYRMRFRLSSHS